MMKPTQMVIKRIQRTTFDKGPLAGIPVTLWTKQGLPVCCSPDEFPEFHDPATGETEPLPDRMVALDYRSRLWIGIGDGQAIRVPEEMGLTLRLGLAPNRIRELRDVLEPELGPAARDNVARIVAQNFGTPADVIDKALS